MTKALRFIRSMRFGMLLLLPVLLCSVIGSIIPQGESEALYAQNFPGIYHLILGLGLDHVFSGWVFLLLTSLFCVNLALCSYSQLKAVPGRIDSAELRAMDAEIQPEEGVSPQRIEQYLQKRRWRRKDGNGRTVFCSPAISWYGSVITHFSILGIILAAAGIFALTANEDFSVFPGVNVISGGVTIRLEDFHIRDETGRIDYASTMEVISPNGRSSGVKEVRVNRPLRFENKKYYQQTYGTAGEITVYVKATGENRLLHMTEQGVISAGGSDGIMYNNVYPGYVKDENGNLQVIIQPTEDYADPVYYIVILQKGEMEPKLVFPGESVETSDAVYTFGEPIKYPGIRVKTTPMWAYTLLYLSFAMIILGLYLCFFVPAAAVAVDENSWCIIGKKWESELRQRFALNK